MYVLTFHIIMNQGITVVSSSLLITIFSLLGNWLLLHVALLTSNLNNAKKKKSHIQPKIQWLVCFTVQQENNINQFVNNRCQISTVVRKGYGIACISFLHKLVLKCNLIVKQYF